MRQRKVRGGHVHSRVLVASVVVLGAAVPTWVAAGGGGGGNCWKEDPGMACNDVTPPPGYTCIVPMANEPCPKTGRADEGAKLRNGFDRTCSFYPGQLQPDGSCKQTGLTLYEYTVRCHEAVGERCPQGGR